MELSKYQLAIEAAANPLTSNLMVQARAGSGKTFIIKRVARLLPETNRILFVAFNKHIADVLKKDLPYNVMASTLNSFGWQICRAGVKGLSYKVDAYKTDNIAKTFYNMNDKTERSKYYKEKGMISRIISLLKATCVFTPPDHDQILNLADEYGLDVSPKPEFTEIVKEIYRKCISYTSLMDFDDQVFMPIFLNLAIPRYDVVIVDEGQDLNPIQQELVIRAGAKVIVVGDDKQAIYGFRGADPRSMSNMREKLNATVLPLSICYRCPKKVVQLAQTIVPDIEWALDAKDGCVENIKSDKFEAEAKDGDYVLCRTTAPLVSTCLRFIREGRKAIVRGRDIGQQLMALVNKLSDSPYEQIVIFRDKLNAYRMEQVERLERAERDAEIIALNDRVDTIMVLVERCVTVGDIQVQVDEIFKDEKILPDGTVIKLPGVVFCTVHKSKGLEAERIYILKGELMPHPAAKKPWQVEQEMNLKYVAITRALDTLKWVVE